MAKEPVRPTSEPVRPIEVAEEPICLIEAAEEPVHPIEVAKRVAVDDSSDEKARADTQLVVATLIATVTFAAAIAFPGGYKSDNGPDQGTPFLIRDVAFKAFVITNALAFSFSLAAVGVHFEESLYFSSTVFESTGRYISCALLALVIAFSTGTYAVLEHSRGLAIATCCIGICCYFFVPIHNIFG
ncbi:hypothetical protein REPUB_Repub15cG0052100 [Reevesia pubescens]